MTDEVKDTPEIVVTHLEEAHDAQPSPIGPAWVSLAQAVGIIWALEIGLSCLTFGVLFVASGFKPGAIVPRIEYMMPELFLSWAGAILIIWYFTTRKFHLSVLQALAIRRASWRALALCVLAGALCAVGAGILMALFSTGQGIMTDLVYEPPKEPGGVPHLSMAFVVVALTVPMLEEVYYRGFLYGALRKLLGIPVAAAIIVVWFGMVHAPQLFGDWVGLAAVTLMGGLFTFLRQWYDSLWPSVAAHLTYNACLALFSAIGLSMMQ